MGNRIHLLKIYLILALAVTLLLNLRLLNRADSAGSGPFLGYSLSRIVLLAPVLIFVLVIGWLIVKAWRDPIWHRRCCDRACDTAPRLPFGGDTAP